MIRCWRFRRSLFVVALCLIASGCNGYSDFTLPLLRGGPPDSVFRWSVRLAPVLARGAPGDWDGVDVLNPSVVKHQGVFYDLYSGFDGKSWHTGLATSPDGIAWARQGKVLSPDPRSWEGDDYIAANGSVLVTGGEFLYWYQGGRLPSIGLARSPDARRWTRLPDPVLRPGHTSGNCQGLRRGRSSIRLASGSSRNCSAWGSHLSFRPSRNIKFARWQTELTRWPMSTGK